MSNGKDIPAKTGYDGSFGIDPDECVVETIEGQALVFPSAKQNKQGCDYVRFISTSGNQQELLYYTVSEWTESPEEVMGCIMAAIQVGVQ